MKILETIALILIGIMFCWFVFPILLTYSIITRESWDKDFKNKKGSK